MKPNPFLIKNQHTSPEVADRAPGRLREAKRLRDETGYPITMCIEALTEAAGDFGTAAELLPAMQREKAADVRAALLLEVPAAPNRYDECAHPVWEGGGWFVSTEIRRVVIRAESDIELNEPLIDAMRTAVCWSVLESGSSNVALVTVRVEAPHRRIAWTVLGFSRHVIQSETHLFHAQELHSPQVIPCEEPDWRSAEAGFKVEVMPWLR